MWGFFYPSAVRGRRAGSQAAGWFGHLSLSIYQNSEPSLNVHLLTLLLLSLLLRVLLTNITSVHILRHICLVSASWVISCNHLFNGAGFSLRQTKNTTLKFILLNDFWSEQRLFVAHIFGLCFPGGAKQPTDAEHRNRQSSGRNQTTEGGPANTGQWINSNTNLCWNNVTLCAHHLTVCVRVVLDVRLQSWVQLYRAHSRKWPLSLRS